MKTKHCPTEGELRGFDNGELAAERYNELAEHLESCAECAVRYERLESQPDQMLEQLRAELPTEALADDSELELLVSRAAALQQTGANAAEATLVKQSSSIPVPVTGWMSEILLPPAAPGELGRLGGYRVLRVMGMGGMGVVLQAEDVALKRMVALKVMKPKVASPQARARFLREAQAMAAVHHDHVVTIYQVGEDRGVPFLAMEMLEGQSLSERLREAKRLSVGEALRIARETALGLAAAHAKGLTHRDIKPDNVWLEGKVEGLGSMVESEDKIALAINHRPSTLNQSRVKILDFGLARAIDDEQGLTQEGAIVGTPNYLSPEQAAGAAVDARTDLFSLGVVLYEMLSGRKPFAQATLVVTLKSISCDPPREMEANVPAEVAAIVKRLLEKRAEDRFASCSEVIAAIEAYQQSLHRPLPVTAIAPKKAKPRRTWIATAAAAALVLMFGVIVTVKDKDGKTLLRYLVPDGGTVEVTADNGGVANKSDKADADKSAPKPVPPNNTAPANEPQVADHLPPMSPLAFTQRPAKLTSTAGEPVLSWTVATQRVVFGGGMIPALRSDGKLLAGFGDDGCMRVWDVEHRKLRQVLLGHQAGPAGPAGLDSGYLRTNSRRFGPVAWQGNTSLLATASRDGSLRVWDVENGTTAFRQDGPANSINMVSWSPGGTMLAAAYAEDGSVRCWKVDGWKEQTPLDPLRRIPRCLVWSPDSTTVAIVSDQGGLLWSPVTAKTAIDARSAFHERRSWSQSGNLRCALVVRWSATGLRQREHRDDL